MLFVVATAIFLASFCTSIFGFGFALISVPLLAFVLPMQTVSPLINLSGNLLSLIVVITTWRTVDWHAAWRLIVGGALGIPLGLQVLLYLPKALALTLIGLLIIGFGSYRLWAPPLKAPVIKHKNWAFVFGFLGGLLSTSYGLTGVPIVLYGSLTLWNPQIFRSSTLAFFLFTGTGSTVAHALGGLWTRELLELAFISWPIVILGTILGGMVHKRIVPEQFHKLLYMLMVFLGITLIGSAFTG